MGRIDEALAEAGRFQELGGSDTLFILIKFLVLLEKNDRIEAANIITTFYSLEGDYPDACMLKLAELLLKEDTETTLPELEEISKTTDLSPRAKMFLAHVASELGGVELAFKSLRDSGFYDVLRSLWHPTNRAIRQLPAFKAYVREIGLYDYWRTTGEWGDFCRPIGEGDFDCE